MASLITKDNKLKINGILYNREPIKVVNNILFVKFVAVICIFELICLIMTSICLSEIVTPCDL